MFTTSLAHIAEYNFSMRPRCTVRTFNAAGVGAPYIVKSCKSTVSLKPLRPGL